MHKVNLRHTHFFLHVFLFFFAFADKSKSARPYAHSTLREKEPGMYNLAVSATR